MPGPWGVPGPVGCAWSGGVPGPGWGSAPGGVPGLGGGIPACTEADPPCEQNS